MVQNSIILFMEIYRFTEVAQLISLPYEGEKYQIRISAKKLILLHQKSLNARVKFCLTHH